MTGGAWFEGSPGWYVDAQEGWARPIDRRVSPAGIRRLLRQPSIAEPVDRLPDLIMQGLPKVAAEVGAELPELSQVADVVDLVPTFRLAAGGNLIEAQVSLARRTRTSGSTCADGLTVPVSSSRRRISRATGASAGSQTREVHSLRHRGAAGNHQLRGLASSHRDGSRFVARGDDAIRWTEGIGTLPDDWDIFVPDGRRCAIAAGASAKLVSRAESAIASST
jgi:hypothetical protein